MPAKNVEAHDNKKMGSAAWASIGSWSRPHNGISFQMNNKPKKGIKYLSFIF